MVGVEDRIAGDSVLSVVNPYRPAPVDCVGWGVHAMVDPNLWYNVDKPIGVYGMEDEQDFEG